MIATSDRAMDSSLAGCLNPEAPGLPPKRGLWHFGGRELK
jgi:hypothetical protein